MLIERTGVVLAFSDRVLYLVNAHWNCFGNLQIWLIASAKLHKYIYL